MFPFQPYVYRNRTILTRTYLHWPIYSPYLVPVSITLSASKSLRHLLSLPSRAEQSSMFDRELGTQNLKS